ncbi:hypothetical protein PsAD13_04983 [Pseudovibrio sp. Ad13]|uniref:hypothetical protein n=1 Tax=unclassified Pseudovibrio TaxID=2627060 RepID=UPI0007AEA351|nr:MULTISPECIES: hypothetical protein [unclassified Pseudovibrio]KZK79991.1 hypothetical protein PsAD13_04983 [Pseudovibrio sp. Ad13]
MRKTQIEEISLGAADLASSATDLLGYFNSSTESGSVYFNVKKNIHGTDISYADCLSRVVVVADISETFGKSNHSLLVPLPRILQLKQAIDGSKQHLDTLANQFRQIVQGGGGVGSFNYDNFHLQTVNGQNHDFRAFFKNFCDTTESLLEAFFSILVVLRPSKATFSFQAAANALSSLVQSSSEEIEKLRTENMELKKAVADALTKASDTRTAWEEAVRLKDESAKERKTIGEYLADATEKKASIDSIQYLASSLEDEVTQYQNNFDGFDKRLKARNADFEEGNQIQRQLFERFQEQEQSVTDLINQSEGMLKGATVAGLASSFSTAHEELGRQLLWARISFYIGIFFLFISAVPLMVYVFLPILVPFLQGSFPELASIASTNSPQTEVTGWQYLGQVMARFIILLPAAWFVSFSAIRHSSLFRLREHYAYKYSMAVSVEGFQKQAKGYENEIAALVLEQLAFNPADKLIPSKDIKEGKIPQPMLNLFLERFRSGLDKETK